MQMVEPIFLVVVLVISVIIHEVSHGYVANFLGDPTARLAGRLTLNPLKHLDPVGSLLVPALLWFSGTGFIFGWAKPVPYNPHQLGGGKWGPAYVAAAGPAANLILALVFGLVWRLGLFTSSAVSLLAVVILINLALAVFNLLPVPPLDGSKILFSFFSYRYRSVENWLSRYQLVLFIALIIFITRFDFLGGLIFTLFRLLTGVA